MKGKKDQMYKTYMRTYLILTLVSLGAIVFSLIRIQVVEGSMWREKAEQRTHTQRIVPATRGVIYSSDGQILASTIMVCDLYIDMGRVAKKDPKGRPLKDRDGVPIKESLIADSNYVKYLDHICELLAEETPQSASYFRDKLNSERAKDKPSRCFLVYRALPLSTWNEICNIPGWRHAIVKQVDERSVIRQVRSHTYGNMAGNVIGFSNGWLDSRQETFTGLEGFYNDTLRGIDGLCRYRRLTKSVWIEEGGHSSSTEDVDTSGIEQVSQVVNGSSIVATIDTRYQDIAENSLRKLMSVNGGQSGCAILMEIKTGYILACVNLTYDTAQHRYREMENANVACSDIYEPGSTFKSVILTAMMNDTTIDTAMRVRIGQKDFPVTNGHISDDSHHNAVDTVSISKVIALSSNVGMSELGWKYYRTNRNKLRKAVEDIFPYDILNIDLRTGEYKGHVNDLNASGRDFLNFCYGYSTSVSPLQVLTFYNALGGGGRMVKPLFCKEIINGNRRTMIRPVVLKERICSERTAAIMKDLLVGVVEKGTGDNIKNNTYGIAGKTGTAIHNYAGSTRYNASFAGFFPAECPKYSCLVMVQDIPAHGRKTAEVFRDIANCVVAIDTSLGNISLDKKKQKNKDIKPESLLPQVVKAPQADLMRAYGVLRIPYISADSASTWTTYEAGVDSLHTKGHYVAYQVPTARVPNCLGMTVRDALRLLHAAGINQVHFTGYGKVKRQEPRPNAVINGPTAVYLNLE